MFEDTETLLKERGESVQLQNKKETVMQTMANRAVSGTLTATQIAAYNELKNRGVVE